GRDRGTRAGARAARCGGWELGVREHALGCNHSLQFAAQRYPPGAYPGPADCGVEAGDVPTSTRRCHGVPSNGRTKRSRPISPAVRQATMIATASAKSTGLVLTEPESSYDTFISEPKNAANPVRQPKINPRPTIT